MNIYMVGYMMDSLKTGYQNVFATTAQEAADKIREKDDVLCVLSVYLQSNDWN